ncbi:TRIC cation channel family protein, partial [Mycobacteroides chelonae]|nr:TRIC cation channel family protein [Mycobacteroides chelonae]
MTTVALMTNSVELHSLVSISHVVLDYLGTLAFAMSAALVAVEKKFDIVGLAVLAMVTAIGGGVIRDLI